MLVTELEVARAVQTVGAKNAADSTEAIVDRVELYYRNETFSEANRLKPVKDEFGVSDRNLVPLDVDRVKLYAVVWAKLSGDEEFRPYCGDGFDNDGNFFNVGAEFGPGMGEDSTQGFGEKPSANPEFKIGLMRRARLDPDVPKLLRWPWQDLEFKWREVFYKATSRMILVDKTDEDGTVTKVSKKHRTYKYAAQEAIDAVTETDGWTLVLPMTESGRLPAGTRRFRVTAKLPDDMRKSRRRGRGGKLKSCGDKNVEKGFALRLSVRMAAVPTFSVKNDADGIGPRSKELQEMLRWMTAFLDTPYENGGMWFGGLAKVDDPQKSGYQGHGMDCNGSISSAALLAGVEWPDMEVAGETISWPDNWHRNTFVKGNHKHRFPGVQVSRNELRPGDLLDKLNRSHVRLVWRLWDDPVKGRMVSWIESSGSGNKVRMPEAGQKLARVARHFHLINMHDPQPRGKEKK